MWWMIIFLWLTTCCTKLQHVVSHITRFINSVFFLCFVQVWFGIFFYSMKMICLFFERAEGGGGGLSVHVHTCVHVSYLYIFNRGDLGFMCVNHIDTTSCVIY